MKVCVFLLLIVAYKSAANNVTIANIRTLWKGTVEPFKTKCMCQTGIKQSTIDEFYKYGGWPDDPCWKCLLHCNGFNLGCFSATGEVDVKKWSETFDYLNLPLAQKCASIVHPDPCQKAYLLVKCVDENLAREYPLEGSLDMMH